MPIITRITRGESVEKEVARFAVRLADDALILAQRLCEWSGKAPMLEEDLALSNTGLDFLGRARMLYTFAGERLGCTEDELAYTRDTRDFSNLLISELPIGDFAFTMVRQYLIDTFERRYFARLATSKEPVLAAVAEKTIKEVSYHHRRSLKWLQRLGLGTSESNTRAEAAIASLWGYVDEMFAMDALETALADLEIAVDRSALRDDWTVEVTSAIADSGLVVPDSTWQVSGGRQGVHTEHLGHLLGEMQILQRSYPGLEW